MLGLGLDPLVEALYTDVWNRYRKWWSYILQLTHSVVLRKIEDISLTQTTAEDRDVKLTQAVKDLPIYTVCGHWTTRGEVGRGLEQTTGCV